MTTLKLDSATHDLVVVDGAFAETSGEEEIRQRVKIRLMLVKGEVPWDQDLGVPYWEEVTNKGVAASRIESIFRKVIEDTPGVIEVIEGPDLDFNASTRTLSISFRATTDVGELVYADVQEVA